MSGRLALAFVAFVWLGVGASWCSPVAVEADKVATHVELARVFVSEAGWDQPVEWAAIYSVLRNRSTKVGIGWDHLMRLYSSRVFDPKRRDRRRWLANLQDAQAPVGWPEQHVPWKQWGLPKWERAVKEAAAIIREDRVTCPALDWGCNNPPQCDDITGYMLDNPEAVVIDCGDTNNVFLIPRPATEPS